MGQGPKLGNPAYRLDVSLVVFGGNKDLLLLKVIRKENLWEMRIVPLEVCVGGGHREVMTS